MLKKSLKTMLAVSALGLAAFVPMAQADFPERPVEFIVPWPPGDLEDVLGRMISDQVQDDYGVPSAVVNMKGGGGVIGATHVSQQAADGYSVGVFTGNILTAHIIKGRAPFGQGDFEPLGVFLSYPMALVARGDLPANNMAELAAYAKNNPVKLAHFGFNGPPTKQTMLAAKQLGFEYAGSAAYDETNCNVLASGDADVMVTTVKLVKACLDSGDAKALAAYTSARIKVLPEVATLEEQVSGVAAPAWAGLFVTKDTPAEARAKIIASAEKAIASEAAQNIAANTGAVIQWMPAAEAADFVDVQYQRVEQLLAQ